MRNNLKVTEGISTVEETDTKVEVAIEIGEHATSSSTEIMNSRGRMKPRRKLLKETQDSHRIL